MSDDELIISAKEFLELEPLVGEIVIARQHEIVDGKLDGRHWFLAVLAEAQALQRQRRQT